MPLPPHPLRGTGDAMCCRSGFVGTDAYLFAGHNQSGEIDMLEFGPGGALSFIGRDPFATEGGKPAYLAVNAAGDRLLATTSDNWFRASLIRQYLDNYDETNIVSPEAMVAWIRGNSQRIEDLFTDANADRSCAELLKLAKQLADKYFGPSHG